ncbi:alpha/beta hydrolase [Catenulispora subtropica]|uniref:Dienelactone hydrolase domain-containing protein n=1 Tax=Catenulispora subtropica TaxID=450798 RepID=A0ABP5EYQ0_9ACTN
MDSITFVNNGNTVVGNLFKPDGFQQGTRYPAIVITQPIGAVKEQVSTTYAKLLAAQGFIALVFDASYQGEIGGEPHFSDFPSARVEDIRCAVDFLSTPRRGARPHRSPRPLRRRRLHRQRLADQDAHQGRGQREHLQYRRRPP